jgi:hypothetical protein
MITSGLRRRALLCAWTATLLAPARALAQFPSTLAPDGGLYVHVTNGGSGSNAAAGSTALAVPASADYMGGNKGGNLVGVLLDSNGYLEMD